MFNINNIDKKIIILFSISLFLYYFLTPLLIYFNIIDNYWFKLRILHLSNLYLTKPFYIHQLYEILTILLLILLIFYFSRTYKKIKIQKEDIKNYSFILNAIIIISIFFLLQDIFILLKEYITHYNLYSKRPPRDLLYSLINNRKTYLNLLIIFSTVNFRKNKKLSYLSFVLIVMYDILSNSRISSFFLIVLNFFVNVELKKNFLTKILLLIFLLTIVVFYRVYFYQQHFNIIFGDAFDLKISSVIFLNNFLNFSFKTFFYENILFLLRDFFYFNVNYTNFFISDQIPYYSIRGIDSIICHFFVFLIYSFLFLFLIKYFPTDFNFLHCLKIYLLICLFRGNFVHNLNFIIKTYLLVIIFSWLIKKIKLLKSRVD
jgi:hypothetical protein